MGEQEFKSGLSFQGKQIKTNCKLMDEWGYRISDDRLYEPYFDERYKKCGMRLTCNGYSRCGRCS